jgi:hypothetical protein
MELLIVSCALNGTQNLLTSDPTDFANESLVAGVVGSGSVTVKDVCSTYPRVLLLDLSSGWGR